MKACTCRAEPNAPPRHVVRMCVHLPWSAITADMQVTRRRSTIMQVTSRLVRHTGRCKARAFPAAKQLQPLSGAERQLLGAAGGCCDLLGAGTRAACSPAASPPRPTQPAASVPPGLAWLPPFPDDTHQQEGCSVCTTLVRSCCFAWPWGTFNSQVT
jgi:hypothetical protein